MKKLSINPMITTILVLVSILAGFQYTLFALAFVFLFTEDEKAKNLSIRVVVISLVCLLINQGWGLIQEVVDFIYSMIKYLFGIVQAIDEEAKFPKFLAELFGGIIPDFIVIVSKGLGVFLFAYQLFFIGLTIKDPNKKDTFPLVSKLVDKIIDLGKQEEVIS